MKVLAPLNSARLTVLEFGQHTKSVHKGIGLLGNALITDTVFTQYLATLNTQNGLYDKAMLYISKSDETAKITAADLVRDNAVKATLRYLSVFELTDEEPKQLAHASLETLFKTYNGVQKWNYEEESNGLDNLITELQGAKYAPHVETLQMGTFVEKIKNSNDAFKVFFEGRTQEFASKEVFDVKALRKNLKTVYDDMAMYVLSMAKVHDVDQYNKPLSVINTVRKYYADRLATRPPAKKGEVPVPIDPMP